MSLEGESMIPNIVLLHQNLSFTTEAKEQEQMSCKSVIAITGKNAQMNSMASTKRTTPEITSVVTKAMMVRFSERSSVLAHCFYSVRPKLNLNLSNFYLVFLKHYYAYCT